MTETPINDTNAIISIIDDAIADSLGPDWNSFQAAHHVMQWLADAGLQIVPNTRAVNSHHRLIEALEAARKIIADIDDYMKRPSRGDWGAECACCMGELLDDDRDTIAKIDAALKEAGRG